MTEILEFAFILCVLIFFVADLCHCIYLHLMSDLPDAKVYCIVIRCIIYLTLIFLLICFFVSWQLWLGSKECTTVDWFAGFLVYVIVATGYFIYLIYAFYYIIKIAALPREARLGRKKDILKKLGLVQNTLWTFIILLWLFWGFAFSILRVKWFAAFIHKGFLYMFALIRNLFL